jgi:queuosine precursor transporter
MMRYLPGVIAMAAIVVASNILVQYLLWDGILTWGAFTYPFAFLVNDLTNRLQGPTAARRVVLAGFVIGILCSFIAWNFGLTTLRIALGSGLAFLAAQLLDITIFNRLRKATWWKAPFIATILASVLDTAIFFTVAFSAAMMFLNPSDPQTWATDANPLLHVGPMLPYWVSLATADLLVKLAIAIVALIPFRIVAGKFIAPIA